VARMIGGSFFRRGDRHSKIVNDIISEYLDTANG
jgi:hypothetical protein